MTPKSKWQRESRRDGCIRNDDTVSDAAHPSSRQRSTSSTRFSTVSGFFADATRA
jgi:hypothetical protein